jgi:hypothetical protein
MLHQNRAARHSPAHVICVVNATVAMGRAHSHGHRLIDVAHGVLRELVIRMLRMSTMVQDGAMEIVPRYNMAILAYTDTCGDLYGGWISISRLPSMGLPAFTPIGRANPVRGLEAAYDLLLASRPALTVSSPAPIVYYLTNMPDTSQNGIVALAHRIKAFDTSDGPVVFATVLIPGDELLAPGVEPAAWSGITTAEELLDQRLVTLFRVSSRLPDSYLVRIRRAGFTCFASSARLLLPGLDPSLVATILPVPPVS